MLQHGSVLLSRSEHARELPGIAQAAERPVAASELLRAWADRLAIRLDLNWVPSSLPAEFSSRAAWWFDHRFAHSHWTRKR
jgi:lipoate-protein ligase A